MVLVRRYRVRFLMAWEREREQKMSGIWTIVGLVKRVDLNEQVCEKISLPTTRPNVDQDTPEEEIEKIRLPMRVVSTGECVRVKLSNLKLVKTDA